MGNKRPLPVGTRLRLKVYTANPFSPWRGNATLLCCDYRTWIAIRDGGTWSAEGSLALSKPCQRSGGGCRIRHRTRSTPTLWRSC